MSDSLKAWLNEHDDKLSFTLLYVGLSVFLSIYISLFWLIPIVAAHAFLEANTLEEQQSNKAWHVFMHLKLDIVLIIFALCLAVYFEAIFGLLGLSAASRGAAQGGARFIAWQRSIRGTLMTLDDAAQLAKGIARVKSSSTEDKVEQEADGNRPSKLDYLTLGFGVLMLLGIAFAPFLIEMSYTDVLKILADELHPWPSK